MARGLDHSATWSGRTTSVMFRETLASDARRARQCGAAGAPARRMERPRRSATFRRTFACATAHPIGFSSKIAVGTELLFEGRAFLIHFSTPQAMSLEGRGERRCLYRP